MKPTPTELDLLRTALASVPRPLLIDHSFLEADLEAALVGLGITTLERAREIIDWRTRDGETEAEGEIKMPGFAPYPYEPHQLLRNGTGRMCELEKASPEFFEWKAKVSRQRLLDAYKDVPPEGSA